MTSRSTRKGKGRQKTKMEKIENESNLQVTFSKRKNGLFKKAFELSIMTEAELAIIVYSPSGKVYSFSHPSFEIVDHKFLTGNPQTMSYMQQLIQDQRDKHVTKMIAELKTIENNLEAEIKCGKDLNRRLAQSQNKYWGASNKNDCQNLPIIKLFVADLKNLKGNVKRKIEARALVGQQNNVASTGYENVQTKMLQPLMGPNYNGVVSENGLPITHRGHNLYQVSEGSKNVSGYGDGSGWSFTNGPSLSTSRGLPAFLGLNVNEGGEGSRSNGGVYGDNGGKSIHNGHGSFGGRYLPYTRRLNINEGGQVNSGGGNFYGGASGWLFNAGTGREYLISRNGASSFGVANNDGNSIDRVPELVGSMPSHGFGVDFRYI